VLGAYRPAVILAEVNAKFPPPLMLALAYSPAYDAGRR
jgi:hypothetical protein